MCEFSYSIILCCLTRKQNWFQNRRAKAKQERKQAEYQNEQQKESGSKADGDGPSRDQDRENRDAQSDEDDEDVEQESSQVTNSVAGSNTSESYSMGMATQQSSTSPADEKMRQKSYDSLNRALKAAEAAQEQIPRQWPHVGMQMPVGQPVQTKVPALQSPLNTGSNQNLLTKSWRLHHADQQAQIQQATNTGNFNFDFGFDTSDLSSRDECKPLPSPTDSASHSGISTSDWTGSAMTPTVSHFHQSLQSPGLPTPTYSSSRRGSNTEGLTTNFEGFAIGTPPFGLQSLNAPPFDASDIGNDIASRRRRPRPAALTSASLRSRSYGQLSAHSPTMRQGIPSASTQSIRHVKSTGHSLHNHYAGIRKSSLPQRSPLNVSTFAEADFQLLMAQNAKQQMTTSHDNRLTFQQEQSQVGYTMPQMNSCAAPPNGQSVQSPPATPYQQDYFAQSSSILLPSVQAQYATMPDFTPPYSAGPMTNSSWPDGPLTSPDVTNFPQMSYLPSLPNETQYDDVSNLWNISTGMNTLTNLNGETEGKQAQFRIETFPNQEQEHAQISQHFNRTRPNHFVFQHFGQGDFSPSKS